MQSYDNMRGYLENNLADSITNRKKMEIAFLEMPGFGINRLW